jgi:uncharacterized protein (DUF1499 family)
VYILVKKSNKVGIIDGKFYPCPETPNCVSTQSTDELHKIEPLTYDSSLEKAKEIIVEIINSIKRTKIITQTNDYLHAEFKSRIFKFIDDVEFYFDDNNKIIHFKSASRVGNSDMGVNRKRMEDIRKRFVTD